MSDGDDDDADDSTVSARFAGPLALRPNDSRGAVEELQPDSLVQMRPELDTGRNAEQIYSNEL